MSIFLEMEVLLASSLVMFFLKTKERERMSFTLMGVMWGVLMLIASWYIFFWNGAAGDWYSGYLFNFLKDVAFFLFFFVFWQYLLFSHKISKIKKYILLLFGVVLIFSLSFWGLYDSCFDWFINDSFSGTLGFLLRKESTMLFFWWKILFYFALVSFFALPVFSFAVARELILKLKSIAEK